MKPVLYSLYAEKRIPGEPYGDNFISSFSRYDFYHIHPDGKKELIFIVPQEEFDEIYVQGNKRAYSPAIGASSSGEEITVPDQKSMERDRDCFDEKKLNNIFGRSNLFLKSIENFLEKYDKDKKIVFNIVSNESSILDIPWETLHIGRKTFSRLGDNYKVLRHLSEGEIDIETMQFDPKLINIVIFWSKFDNSHQRMIEDQIRGEIYFLNKLFKDNIRLVECTDINDLDTAIKDMQTLDILHFTGHGSISSLQIKDGSQPNTDIEKITAIIKKNNINVKYFVANCCFGSNTDIYTKKSVGFKLIESEDIGNVLSFRYELEASDSQNFVEEFYGSLVKERNIYKSYLLLKEYKPSRLYLYGR